MECMRLPKRLSIFFMLLGFLLSACGGTQQNTATPPTQTATRAPDQATEVPFTAKLSEIAGNVLAREAHEPSFAAAQNGYVLPVLGQVQTQTDGKVRLDFSGGSLIRIGPGTLFTLQPPQQDSQGLLIKVNLAVGRLWVILQGGSLEVETKSGVAAVRGSYMSVSYNPDTGEASISCLEGACSLSTPGGNVQITAGQTATVTGANQPPHVGKMNDSDVQDWLTNNPEATVVVPPLTQAPASTEATPATDVPVATSAALPTQAFSFFPAATAVPTSKSSGQDQATATSAPFLTGTATATATVTMTATVTPTITATKTKYTPTLVISSINPEPSVFNQSVTITISAQPANGGPTPTGTVSVSIGANSICSNLTLVSGSATCNYAFSQVGNFNLVADYSGDVSNTSAQSATKGHTVNQAGTTTSITSNQQADVGTAYDFTATVDVNSPGSGTPTGSVVFSDGTDSCTAYSAPWKCSITFAGPGSKSFTATYSGDTNFAGSTSSALNQEVFSISFSEPAGPGTSDILSSRQCSQTFSVSVTGSNGMSSVDNFVEYSINDSTFSSPSLIALYSQGGPYLGSDSIQATLTDTIYWRFSFKDGSGNQAYFGDDTRYLSGSADHSYQFSLGDLPICMGNPIK